MRDPSADWSVPYDPQSLPGGGLGAAFARPGAPDTWRIVALTRQLSVESPAARHEYGVALLLSGMPFAAAEALGGLFSEAPGAPPPGAAALMDMATATVRTGFWDAGFGRLMELADELHRADRASGPLWEELAHRCRALHRSLFLRDEERTLQRLRLAWFEELEASGAATPEHRLARARAHLALADIDVELAEYDAAARVLLPLADVPEVAVTALEMLVEAQLRAGPEHPEDGPRARALLHRVHPHSRILTEGAHGDDAARWLADLEAYHAAGFLLQVAQSCGDRPPGPYCRRVLVRAARSRPEQPRYVVAAARALLDGGEPDAASAVLDRATAPVGAEEGRALAAAFTEAGRPDLADAHLHRARTAPGRTE
ncbi:hypothetical protein OG422_19155 [Streptomyces sp. NBC_01525]|uniref:hypothetical protein n=1 Tax=Streptomyces sp. NBC_01525 TaxID=2903893 RepID=UPI003870D6D9